MRESKLEELVCAYAKKRGWLVRKLTWIGRRGAPDRFFARDGVLIFVEFKQEGERPRLNQAREIRRLQEQGVRVEVIDNVEDGYRLLA